MYPLTEFSSGLTSADNRVSLRGQPSLCKYFIKIRFDLKDITSGALLEVFSKGVRLPDCDGFTPLHYATHNRQEEAPVVIGRGGGLEDEGEARSLHPAQRFHSIQFLAAHSQVLLLLKKSAPFRSQ